MTLTLVRSKANIPLIAALWSLTLFSLIPFASTLMLIAGCLCNLTANVIAIFLLFQPGFANRLNGGIRLILQVLTLLIGIFLFIKSGVTPFSILQSMKSQLP